MTVRLRRTARVRRADRLRPTGWGTVLGAVLALGVVLLVRPPHAPPLYDGLGFPDEPYRWVGSPPVGAAGSGTTATATNAAVTVALGSDGVTEAVRALSAEQGPQVAFALAAGAVRLPAGTTRAVLGASPARPPAPPPGGQLVSNLYRFVAGAATASTPPPTPATPATPTTPAGTSGVTLTPGRSVVVNLRADQATTRTVVLETWDGHTWTQQPTSQVGTDVYAAELPALTAFALVRLDPGVTVTAHPASTGATGAGAGPAASGSGTATDTATGSATAAGLPRTGAGPGTRAGDAAPVLAAPVLAARASGPSTGVWIGLGAVLALIAAGLLTVRLRGPGTRHESDAVAPMSRHPDV